MADTNPYAPPEAPPEQVRVHDDRAPRPYVDGEALVVHPDARLPKRCIKCATKADVSEVPSPFEYVPPWARVAFGALGALAFRRTVTLALPFCQSCVLILKERRSAFTKVVLGGLAMMFVPGGLAVVAGPDAKGPFALLTLIGFIAGLALIVTRRKRDLDPYIVRSNLIKDGSVWLLGACSGFVERATRPPKRRA